MEVKRWEVLDGVSVWLADLGDVTQEEWALFYHQMEPARRERCRRAQVETAKRRVLADALARQALEALSGQPGAEVSFHTRPGGKPYVPGLGVEFSLSHSGDLVLCAAATFPVGADLQKVRPLSPAFPEKMARAGYRGRSQEEFFRWWVEQEAAGKLTGQGFRLAPIPAPPLCHTGALEGPDGEYWYCVCAQGPQRA